MSRLHVHIAVADIDKNIGFHSSLFGSEPNVIKPDYARWGLQNPS
ncbi:VOC family protein [Thiohalophilus thiocyanatoxydans]|nr:hypothetical protein [Thiohalophilus thiocyanatoxydans]